MTTTKIGRPALLTEDQLQQIRAALAHCDRTGEKFPRAELAARFEVSPSTVARAARRLAQ